MDSLLRTLSSTLSELIVEVGGTLWLLDSTHPAVSVTSVQSNRNDDRDLKLVFWKVIVFRVLCFMTYLFYIYILHPVLHSLVAADRIDVYLYHHSLAYIRKLIKKQQHSQWKNKEDIINNGQFDLQRCSAPPQTKGAPVFDTALWALLATYVLDWQQWVIVLLQYYIFIVRNDSFVIS